MEFDKEQIVNMLIQQGKQHLVPEARKKLPKKVHHEKHSGKLQELGLDPGDIAKNLMGRKGLHL